MYYLMQQDINESGKYRIVALNAYQHESFECIDLLKPAQQKYSSQNTDVNLELKKAATVVAALKETQSDMLGFYWESERRAKKAVDKLAQEFKLSTHILIG